MKKIIIVFWMFFLSSVIFAQKATILLSEDFSGNFPPTGWTIDDMASQWSKSQTSNSGGEAPEAKLTYTNGTHTTRFISPETDLTGYATVIFSFKHFLDDYSGSEYTIGVATRSGGGSWNDVWTVNPADDMGPETKDFIISNADVGASDFQVCIYLTGNMYNFDYWYIDDIQLFAPDNIDETLSSINNNPYLGNGTVDINCTIKNMGLTNITSTDINYQIDNGTIITDNLSGINLATNDALNHTFSTQWNATPGDHNLKAWVSNINGNGADDDTDNDTLNITMHVATQNVARTPLYEEFTSSTCSPCATFNSTYFTTSFLNNNAGNYSLIKYQMNWPSPGDDYYTAEGGTRRAYYGVAGVPTLFIDANVGTHFNTSQLQNDLDNELAKPAFFDISANANVNGTTINVNTDITPYVNADNFTVQIAVVEKTTTGNVGSNGETEFHNVMMKMLPNASGTQVNFISETPVNINETYDMSSTNVEEYSDLAVIIFIQNDETHEVFQSKMFEPTVSPEVTFNPSDGSTNVNPSSNITVTFNQAMRKVDDSEITDGDISSIVTLTDSSGDIVYTGTINAEKTIITIDPDEDLPLSADITVTVAGNSVETVNDEALPESSATFTVAATGINNVSDNFKISPNPANDFIKISGLNSAEVIITDISGKQLINQHITSENEQINIQKLNSGVYFINVVSAGNSMIKKFIKK